MVRFKQSSKISYVITVLAVTLVTCWFGYTPVQADQPEATKVEQANKEGGLSFYTSMSLDVSQRLLNGFNKRYPFIKTELYRAGSAKLLMKITTEAKAKKNIADVILSDSQDTHNLINAGLVWKYVSPESKAYAKEFKHPDGFWTSSSIITRVLAYNTKLVSPADVPKKYEDLLDPKWKGKMGMPSDEIGWFAGILSIMGREKGIEFMKKLVQQDIQFRTGKTLLTQLLAAGEFSLAVITNSDIVEFLHRNGANVEWVGLEPVVSILMPVMVANHAPHPHAAMLFVDFVLSKEGQEIIRSVKRIPLRPDVPPDPPRLLQGLKLLPSDPSWTGKEYTQLYREIFSRKGGR